MSKDEVAICPNCEWTGDAFGIASCPQCGANLASFDAFDEEDDLLPKKDEKYPEEIINRTKEDFELME